VPIQVILSQNVVYILYRKTIVVAETYELTYCLFICKLTTDASVPWCNLLRRRLFTVKAAPNHATDSVACGARVAEYGRGRDSDSESSGSPCAACAADLYRLPAHHLTGQLPPLNQRLRAHKYHLHYIPQRSGRGISDLPPRRPCLTMRIPQT
jgi:hypothetical protein